MSHVGRLQEEAGASLVIALAFICFIVVSSLAMLTHTDVSLNNSITARAQVRQGLYAADGGIETGIRTLQTDSTKCPSTSTQFTEAAIRTINDKAVTVTCKTTDGGISAGGGSRLLDGYSAILGSGGLTIDSKPNATTNFLFHADVYSGGKIETGNLPLAIEGNLAYYLTCPPLPANVTLIPPGICSHPPAAPVVSVPTVVIPTVAAPASATIGSCTVYYPGLYTNAPTFGPSGAYYLASGTYYFKDTGRVSLQGSVFGGARGGEKKEITSSNPCATDAEADFASPDYDATAVGSGVTFILGGNAYIAGRNNTRVEIYTRVPSTAPGSPDFGATPGVSVWARTTAQAGYLPVPSNGTGVWTEDDTATIVFHGLTHMPDSVGDIVQPLNSDTSGAATFMGGLIAKGLLIHLNGSGKTEVIAGIGGAAYSAEPRTTLVCASVPGTGARPPTIVEAAVYLDVGPAAPSIKSWRKVAAC